MTTRMKPPLKYRKEEGKSLVDATLFQQFLDRLIYLTITRPDISYSAGVVDQFVDKPCEAHLIAEKRILQYVTSTLCCGFLYKQAISSV